ncbi:ELMO domain-containing protein A-like [Triticum dicoccoides]|uniref:ELMO domain-containing protein n=1 Tax=Triticum turgidum subsp. durum TaxID=4567 RepID=A0A9R1NHK9_TRITD|nr:ELMO domain-containing protein A-like [Triticum dicoccoides]VAH25068.1 unnamed protein product [Triticum turgidum subsp. durum]
MGIPFQLQSQQGIQQAKALLAENKIMIKKETSPSEPFGVQPAKNASTPKPNMATAAKVNAMVGNRTWFGGLFTGSGKKRQVHAERNFEMTPLQEQRMQKLKDRLNIPFDETRPDHLTSLKALWKVSFPDTELTSLVSEQWKDMGWQGPNPATDFRGGGFVSLENLLFFARRYPASFQKLLLKTQGMRATWEYPFATAGVNISHMLIQLLELNSARPKTLPGINFVRMLSEHEDVLDILYCIAFEMMDAQWLAMRASYMQFNDVLEATKAQLERELSLEDLLRIQDLPAYNLLLK